MAHLNKKISKHISFEESCDVIEPMSKEKRIFKYFAYAAPSSILWSKNESTYKGRITMDFATNVTRLGDFLHFGQFLKPLATINLPIPLTFLGNFCKGVKIIHFSSEIILGNFYRHLAIFIWSHWTCSTKLFWPNDLKYAHLAIPKIQNFPNLRSNVDAN